MLWKALFAAPLGEDETCSSTVQPNGICFPSDLCSIRQVPVSHATAEAILAETGCTSIAAVPSLFRAAAYPLLLCLLCSGRMHKENARSNLASSFPPVDDCRVLAPPPALNDAAEPFDANAPQPDTALARPKFSLFKPSSELILNKLLEMRAAGRSEPPPAVCEVYRRSESGSPGPSSPRQERCGPEGATVAVSLAAQDAAKTQSRLE